MTQETTMIDAALAEGGATWPCAEAIYAFQWGNDMNSNTISYNVRLLAMKKRLKSNRMIGIELNRTRGAVMARYRLLRKVEDRI